MFKLGTRGYLIIFLSFLIALMLTLLSLPESMQWLRPLWLPLVLIYWMILFPNHVGLFSACLLGLVLDVSSGNVLGVHMLALLCLALLTLKLQRPLVVLPLWQQSMAVLVLLSVYLFIIFVTQGMLGQAIGSLLFCLAAPISMLFWPVVKSILGYFSRSLLIEN